MIKILNRIATGIAVGEEGAVISWRGADSSGKESFGSDFIDMPWNSASEEFSESLKSLVDRSDLNDTSVCLSIPDSAAYTSILTFEELPESLKEREALIKWTVSKNLHISETNLIVDYQVLMSNKDSESINVLTVAVELNLVSIYEDVLKSANLNVWSVGTRTLHSLPLMEKVAKGLNDYIYLYYGKDYFTLLIFKNNEIDFVRTKNMSVVSMISREVSSTLRSYLGSNPDYEYEKFFILTSNKDALKELDVEAGEIINSAEIIEESSIEGSVGPESLLLSSIGAIKS